MVHDERVKVNLDAPGLVKIIINIVVRHHSLSNSIVTNRRSFFTSKFWSLLCYFFGIKQKLLIAFHSQIDVQTERQNSTMEAYFRAFVNFEQNDWVRLLLMAEFVYNNAKNANTGYILFKFNCKYYP